MASNEDKIIAKEILFKLSDAHMIDGDSFPEEKNWVNIYIAAYNKILKAVSED